MMVFSVTWPQSGLETKISPIKKKSDQLDAANIWGFISKPSTATEMALWLIQCIGQP